MRDTAGPVADDPGSLRRFLKVVRPAIYRERSALEISAHHLEGEPVPAAEAIGAAVPAVRSG